MFAPQKGHFSKGPTKRPQEGHSAPDWCGVAVMGGVNERIQTGEREKSIAQDEGKMRGAFGLLPWSESPMRSKKKKAAP